jgi:hypothetical protein
MSYRSKGLLYPYWRVTDAEMRLEGAGGQAVSPARLRSPRHGRM